LATQTLSERDVQTEVARYLVRCFLTGRSPHVGELSARLGLNPLALSSLFARVTGRKLGRSCTRSRSCAPAGFFDGPRSRSATSPADLDMNGSARFSGLPASDRDDAVAVSSAGDDGIAPVMPLSNRVLIKSARAAPSGYRSNADERTRL